jgi:hypothetical protein
MSGFFDMFDQMIAEELEVDTEVYTSTIEKFGQDEMDFIILTMLDENVSDSIKEKAKELFKTKLYDTV